MERDKILDQTAAAMIRYDEGDPRRIQHFLKVHAFARLIGKQEGLDPVVLFRLECAAYVHDIGIHEGERQFGRNDGYIQEKLGPGEAKKLLDPLGLDEEDEKRILWLVGHHHSYGSIDGPDAQILAEADMLVNAYEDDMGDNQKQALYRRLFKTKSGQALFDAMYFHHWDGHHA
jgi:hypothetical protein